MLQEFKKFVLRGNVVDLAVGVVMGAAFATVVSSFSKAFITPLITKFVGKNAFKDLLFKIGKTEFPYGELINAVIAFVITAAVIFFFVVKPINSLTQRMRSEPPPDPTTKKCPECLSEIPVDARRCAFCTTELEMAA
jgi:large conductance mechanosensitive channel